MDVTPLNSLELKQHKTDIEVNLAANSIWASSLDPIQVQNALISSIWKCSLCWVWIRFVSVSAN